MHNNCLWKFSRIYHLLTQSGNVSIPFGEFLNDMDHMQNGSV